jgi:Flp pilus assembly pilin Flp
MKRFIARIAHFVRSDDGATLIAYASLGLLILLIILTLLTYLGQQSAIGTD